MAVPARDATGPATPATPAPDEVAAVPVHPEAVDGDPSSLRWRIPVGTLGFVGGVRSVPAALQQKLDEGVVTGLLVEPDAVRLRLGPGRDWRTEGPRVRRDLVTALAAPDGWMAADTSPDDVLAMAARQVIDGEVGDYVRSHGGNVELVGARDNRVEVRLSGACTHCPGSDLTLTGRFEVALRELCPGVGEVVARSDPGPAGPRRLLGLSALRRRG